jgi:S-methylmethionine-dependent homocysteine/selenocysteine methylase
MKTRDGSTSARGNRGPKRITIIDGGTGSELRRRGIVLDATSWSGAANLSHADLLADIHADYLQAGARVITANTFGTSRFVLEAAGLGDRFVEINAAAVDAAKAARERTGIDATIAASISCLPPAFDTQAYPSPPREAAAYAELAALFAELGVELLMLEMLQDREHAVRACRAAHGSGLPFWIGVSARRNGLSLTAFDDAGRDIEGVLDAVLEHAPAAVNVMHSPVDAVLPTMDAIGRRWTGAIGAYAEIAYPEDPDSRVESALGPSAYASAARAWLDAGATIVGGCCGTTPAHVRALAELVAAR